MVSWTLRLQVHTNPHNYVDRIKAADEDLAAAMDEAARMREEQELKHCTFKVCTFARHSIPGTPFDPPPGPRSSPAPPAPARLRSG